MFQDDLHLIFFHPLKSCHLHADGWRDISFWKSQATFNFNKTAKFINFKRKEEGRGGVFHFQHVVRNEWARVWRQNLGHEMMTRYPWFWSVTVMITDRLVLPEGPGGFLRMAARLEPELRFPPLLFRLCLQHARQTWNLRRATANARCSL